MTTPLPEYRVTPVEALIPYARNARTHSDEQVDQLARSIAEFGFTNPVLVDGDRGIIAGHGRVLAARKLGLAEVPTIRLDHFTPEQKRAYILADNRLALSAGWDEDLLRAEIEELRQAGYDVTVAGFELDEIEALLSPPNKGQTSPDEIRDLPEHPASLTGDVWRLGRHRLVCGDCTDPEAVRLALAGAKPGLMVTDPPYGVSYDPNWRNTAVRSGDLGVRGGVLGARAIGKVVNDDRVDWAEAWKLFPGDVAYVWHAGLLAGDVQASLAAAGFEVRSQIIWEKQHFIIGRGDYHWQHEPCWYAVRKGKPGRWQGDRKQSTIWQIHAQIGWESARPDNEDKATGHGTQKPADCMRRPIVNNSKPGEAVYEPFSGSGTTIIACEMEGRTCHAVEILPTYVDVAILRWQAFTGEKATLERAQDGALEGQAYADVVAERVKVAA